MGNTTTIQKERPIIFSAPMVRAIWEGRKTMTRRVVKPQVEYFINRIMGNPNPVSGNFYVGVSDGKDYWIKCPYGKPGDRLWVRETWNQFGGLPYYRADEPKPFLYSTLWRPSIHMPRAASRILLEITDVRVERLKEITVADCFCEGLWIENDGSAKAYYSAWNEFRRLWKSTHGPESWAQNPWVWVITFKKIEP